MPLIQIIYESNFFSKFTNKKNYADAMFDESDESGMIEGIIDEGTRAAKIARHEGTVASVISLEGVELPALPGTSVGLAARGIIQYHHGNFRIHHFLNKNFPIFPFPLKLPRPKIRHFSLHF